MNSFVNKLYEALTNVTNNFRYSFTSRDKKKKSKKEKSCVYVTSPAATPFCNNLSHKKIHQILQNIFIYNIHATQIDLWIVENLFSKPISTLCISISFGNQQHTFWSLALWFDTFIYFMQQKMLKKTTTHLIYNNEWKKEKHFEQHSNSNTIGYKFSAIPFVGFNSLACIS